MAHEDERHEADPGGDALMAEMKRHFELDAVRREHVLRRQLERTVQVLVQTRQSFRSNRLKQLREEIESVLKSR